MRRYAYHAVQGYTYEEGQQTLQPTAKNVPLLPKTTSILYSTTVATSDADDVARIADEGAGSTDDEESEALTANGEVTSQFGIHANVSNELDLVIAEKRGKKEESRKRRALLQTEKAKKGRSSSSSRRSSDNSEEEECTSDDESVTPKQAKAVRVRTPGSQPSFSSSRAALTSKEGRNGADSGLQSVSDDDDNVLAVVERKIRPTKVWFNSIIVVHSYIVTLHRPSRIPRTRVIRITSLDPPLCCGRRRLWKNTRSVSKCLNWRTRSTCLWSTSVRSPMNEDQQTD